MKLDLKQSRFMPTRWKSGAQHGGENHGQRYRPIDIEPPGYGRNQGSDPSVEMASLCVRLMRALAETENTRRLGERRARDARQYAITGFARELLQVVDNLRRALSAGTPDAEAGRGDGLIDGVVATEKMPAQVIV